MDGYFPTFKDIYLKQGFIKELVKYAWKLQWVIDTDSFGLSEEKEKFCTSFWRRRGSPRSMGYEGCDIDYGRYWEKQQTSVLWVFVLYGGAKSHRYCRRDARVCLSKWSMIDEIDHNLRRVASSVRQRVRSVEDMVGKGYLKTLPRYFNKLRGNYSIEPFTEKFPSPVHCFPLYRFL